MYTNNIVLDLVLALNNKTNFANGTKIIINNTIKCYADLGCGGKLIDGGMQTSITPNFYHNVENVHYPSHVTTGFRKFGRTCKYNARLKTRRKRAIVCSRVTHRMDGNDVYGTVTFAFARDRKTRT